MNRPSTVRIRQPLLHGSISTIWLVNTVPADVSIILIMVYFLTVSRLKEKKEILPQQALRSLGITVNHN